MIYISIGESLNGPIFALMSFLLRIYIIFANKMAKTLYIIAGCNGAGKTTASLLLLPEILDCTEFVNADEIAKGISPFHPEEVAIQAGKLMLERIDVLVEGDKSRYSERPYRSRGIRSPYQNQVPVHRG